MTIISCLKCKSKTGSQTDLRGHQPYEYEFTKLLDDVTIASVVLDKSKPLYSCIDCLKELYIKEQSNPLTLSVPDVLRNTTENVASQNVSATQRTEGTDIPPSSESIPNTIHTQPMAKIASDENSNISDSSAYSDIDILPPRNKNLLSAYNRIMAKPGPISMKRRLVQQLETNDESNNENSEEALERILSKDVHRKRSKKQKTNGTIESNVSSTDQPTSESLDSNRSSNTTSSKMNDPSKDSQSFESNRQVLHSPIIRNSPSMSMITQSRSDELERNRQQMFQQPAPPPPRAVQIANMSPDPSNSSSSSSSSSSSRNAHSNGAAPRRIQQQRQNVKNLGG